ncbi:helix-turn-helix transcriptional regulator [Amycolatopsis sp. H20-H5]|uniref:helix-turn-helix transcriptional regulator n=1 Tax=Amycolatopsis sp. H20-H5 TaxID=3046309 RepID=UPI002DB64C9B|nr:YafY family protein [Amycolatopsis sp. H20-H5]MEC3978377.1 YafY family protein [Amycolatopsis sp. H20-H5]
MLETSARLLRLLSLLQMPREWTGTELAGRLEVSGRTVRNDVERLRSLGYPVHATRGAVGGYRLGAGAAMPPLLLDDEEAVAVAVGLRTAATGTIAGIEETALRALAKLEQVLPSRLRHRVNTLQTAMVRVPADNPGPTIDAATLTAIAAACRDRERLRFDYRGHRGEQSVRVTEPHRLVNWGRRWYLVAWDVDRGDWRTFRVDRLVPKIPTGPRFSAREVPGGDVAAFVSRRVSAAAWRYRARVTVHASAEVVAERINPAVGVVEAVDARTCVLETGADSVETVAVYLGLLGVDFTVTEPPELVEALRVLAERYRRAVFFGQRAHKLAPPGRP